MKMFNAKWKPFLNRLKILNGMVTKRQSAENTCSKSTVKTLDKYLFKRNAQFIFLRNPQKSSVKVCLMKILKSTVTKKITVYFYNLSEENL